MYGVVTQILDCDVSRYTVPDLHGWFKNFDMVSSLYFVFIIDGPFNLLLENICPVKWRRCPSFKWHSLRQYAEKSVYYRYHWIGFHWKSSVLSYYGNAFKVRNCATEHPRSSEPYPGGVQYSCIESICILIIVFLHSASHLFPTKNLNSEVIIKMEIT